MNRNQQTKMTMKNTDEKTCKQVSEIQDNIKFADEAIGLIRTSLPDLQDAAHALCHASGDLHHDASMVHYAINLLSAVAVPSINRHKAHIAAMLTMCVSGYRATDGMPIMAVGLKREGVTQVAVDDMGIPIYRFDSDMARHQQKTGELPDKSSPGA
ncbi:hypothetical protein [Akkermansia glycaniphila]|uniref:Uncharacterized protein n=1 Tax=Akkermansia glycaniphila TaxID=1679444 RepID=A0A1C7P9R1_9BACT|nr:hypothetical protein [Akkermansia glycaniphila]OCA02291.1 hypothetical protein AC781_10695 [Akkermansia glycaniphila]SEH87223.1 Hypothetical protein PYTT_1355 [Akkermansia glycaniphila]